MGNSFGRAFRVTTFGESHGPAVGAVVDGCPPRISLDREDIQRALDRRRPGQSRLVTQRQEADQVEILSGMLDGRTLGTPIALLVRNTDAKGGDYDEVRTKYRPSHADFTYDAKYGIRAYQGGGRASARETVGRVAAGAIAARVLAPLGIEVVAWVERVADLEAHVDAAHVTMAEVDANIVRCPDPAAAAKMETAIEKARKAGDSLGGVVACVCRKIPVGLGDPVMDKLDARLADAMMGLPAAKGVEIGSGFEGTRLTGSTHNDAFVMDGARVRTRTNRAGGILGGISSGEDVFMRVAFKPTATILMEQDTVTTDGKPTTITGRGRHDPCVLPRAVPIVEAMAWLVLVDAWLQQRALTGR